MAQPRDASLDPLAILASLGVVDATRLVPISGGQDTAVWRVERPGGPCALRVFRPEQRPVCDWEVAAMAAAAAGGIPVPAVYAQGLWRNRPALLLSWCRGRPLASELAARPWRLWSLGVAFGRRHAAIHALQAPPALQQAPSWLERLGPPEAGDAAAARLRAALATLSRRDALLHLDYHPLNVLADGRQITAILDWANARAGDPRADLARTYTLLRLAPWPPSHGLRSLAVAAVRRLFERAWRHGYQLASGFAFDPSQLAPYYAWAGRWLERELMRRLDPSAAGWIEPRDLLRIRRWNAYWLCQAG